MCLRGIVLGSVQELKRGWLLWSLPAVARVFEARDNSDGRDSARRALDLHRFCGGESRSSEDVAKMAKFVLIADGIFPGWNGLWGIVQFGDQGGRWSVEEVNTFCCRSILGVSKAEEASWSDFYLYAGGRFRISPEKCPKEIDFEQFLEGVVMPSMTQGIYRLDGDRLRLCVGAPRPSTFRSVGPPHRSLGELVRWGTAQPAGCLDQP